MVLNFEKIVSLTKNRPNMEQHVRSWEFSINCYNNGTVVPKL